METGRPPLISILMAVYEPRLDWLREQLESLEAQTYSNLRLYVRDDCSSAVPFEEIEGLVRACIRSFPYEIRRNEENLGSNLTFERLTQEAGGEYFAYCDQDDVWLPEKLSILQEKMEASGADLVCSDMFIMDGDGKITADSITKVRPRHIFRSGTGLAEGLLISNFVTGCTMLVRSEAAKAAIPFCPYMVHDHYIALCCAATGVIISVTAPLICYRIHGNNQSGVLAGIACKADYERIRIRKTMERLQWLEKNFPYGEQVAKELQKSLLWAEAREKNWRHQKGMATVWQYRQCSLPSSIFEMVAPWIPEFLFTRIVSYLQKREKQR